MALNAQYLLTQDSTGQKHQQFNAAPFTGI